MKKENKRGISPVITTAFLIAMVLILAALIFMWARQFIEDKIEKDGRPIDNVCAEVDFDAQWDSLNNEIILSNNANIPIYAVNIKQVKPGESKITKQTIDMKVGDSKKISFAIDTDTESLIIIPILMGNVGENPEEYPCKNEEIFNELDV